MMSVFAYLLDVALTGCAMVFGYMFTSIIIVPFLLDFFNYPIN
jgi:hypothetical protein